MKANPHKIIVYGICGLFLLSLLFCFGATVYSSIDSVSSSNLKQRLADYDEKARAASSLEVSRAQWFNVTGIIEKFKKEYFLQMDDYTQFCVQLPGLLIKNRLRMVPNGTIRYEYRQLFSDMVRVGVSFAVNGTYNDFKQFIHEVTMVAYPKKMVLFRNIQISKQIQGDIIGEFKMEVYLANQ